MAKSRLTPFIQDLSAGDPEKRKQAAHRLGDLSQQGLTVDEGREALGAAARVGPKQQDGFDPSRELTAAASSHLHDEQNLEAIVGDFPRYSEHARALIVRALADRGDVPAARTFLQIVERHIRGGAVPPARLAGFSKSTEATNLLLPELLKHVGPHPFGYHVQFLALTAAQEGQISKELLASFAPSTIEIYRPMRERMRQQEETKNTDWIWSKEYAADRPHACLLLDLMGYLPAEATLAALEEASASRDPKLQYFAVLSLLRHGRDVPAPAIEAIAASAEVRNWFYDGLALLGRRDLFPARFATQESLAESDMVEWLIYPTELERPPHEIELMATFENARGDERCYLFRFRILPPHWAADDGWMAGLSGPFDVVAMPTTNAGGSTFSKFSKWDEKTPPEHVEHIAGLISAHWKQR